LQTNERTTTQLNQQITAHQANIATLNQSNQRSVETIRANGQRITQLEERLRTSQQDGQTKQTTIANLNQDKVNLQEQITNLTQTATQNTRTLTENQETINQLNQTLERQRQALTQLLANREEELRELETQENN
jgi:chromosome segregation ATPase